MQTNIGYKNRVRKTAIAILAASISAGSEMAPRTAVKRAIELEKEIDDQVPTVATEGPTFRLPRNK